MPTKKQVQDDEVYISNVERETTTVRVLGRSPIILNRMSMKAKQVLLAGAPKKTASEKQANLKHDVFAEYRDSPYRFSAREYSPTEIGLMPSMFKKAMGTAALDIPGAKRTQIGRLVYVNGDLVPLYGIPQIFMSTTRSADINRTPDVRTRAIIKHWALSLDITFTPPIIKGNSVMNLLTAAGLICGVGDWRVEKGSGNYGTFILVSPDDPVLGAEWQEIVDKGGREAQQEALENPEPYDHETADMLSWYVPEMKKRGHSITI